MQLVSHWLDWRGCISHRRDGAIIYRGWSEELLENCAFQSETFPSKYRAADPQLRQSLIRAGVQLHTLRRDAQSPS